MHDVDADNEWMAALDWSRYRRPATDYVSGKLMLSGVVDMIARHVCAPYPTGYDFFLANAANKPPGRLVQPEDAFATDGTPIYSVHARLDRLMREHADELEVPIARSDAITPDEWCDVFEAGAQRWSVGQGARRALAGIAPIVARLASDGKITCFARPDGGGPRLEEISGPDWWDLDPEQAVRRIASCGLNLARPFDAAATPDHIIFVARDDLQKAILESVRSDYVSTAFVDFGKWAFKREIDYYAVQTEEVAAFLGSLMDSGDCEGWTNDDFERRVEEEFGSRGLGRCYERARAIAISVGSRDRFAKRRRRQI